MGKRIDITEMRFGNLVAKYPTDKRTINGGIIWLCHCDCGNKEVYKDGSDLKRGKYSHCEECAKKLKPNAFGGKRYTKKGTANFFEVGTKINHLTIKDIDFVDGTYKKVKYLCSCDCGSGKLVWVNHNNLKQGVCKSCGCLHIESSRNNAIKSIKHTDITNVKRGMLTALYCLDSKMGSTSKWKFICECGNEHVMKANDFLRDRAYSCGCITSKGELFTLEALKEYNINFRRQVSFKGLLGINDGPLRYDFGIYDTYNKLLCLIEFDGYYHKYSNSLTYKGVNVHDSTVEHDKRKNKYCRDNNIKLYRLDCQRTVKKDIYNILKEIKLI